MRPYRSLVLPLGAYQTLLVAPKLDLGDQFTESGDRPRAASFALTTAMDGYFVQKTVTAYLSERAQRDIILALDANLHPDAPRTDRFIEYVVDVPYARIEL